MNWNDLLDNAVINDVLSNLIQVIVIACGGFLIDIIRKYRSEFKSKIENERLQDLIDRVGEIAIQSVNTVSQNFVDTLKEEGTFTVESQEKAMFKSKEYITYLVSEEMIDAVSSLYGDWDVWIETKIESIIRDSKNN